ncbi:galactosyl transferase GMA12/MNN10 family-domain-containing protein [Xylariaceae sp. FL0255]|nr:galactosyl transferase GMA12/MNN10 family-domain-containing protein [Xylariaceae sp. FL0255]
MHYAYPPRKDSHPPPFRPRGPSRFSRLPTIRRSQFKSIGLIGLVIFALIWLFSGSGSGSRSYGPSKMTSSSSQQHQTKISHTISGTPPVVIVTVFDDKYDGTEYGSQIKENRGQYAKKHGYSTFMAKVSDYDLKGAPSSWAKVVAMRHAISTFPDAKYIWYLDQHAVVMNPNTKIEDHVMSASKLDAVMLKDHSVVPPDSIIKTDTKLKGAKVDCVVTQDKDGITTSSIVVKNGEWAKFFLDTWWNPLYRSYNFQKAERHALEHIVQWHPTILSNLAIIPQHIINAYSTSESGAQYNDGDLAVVFNQCHETGATSCSSQAARFTKEWQEKLGSD